MPPQGARQTKPLIGATQSLALWARIFTGTHLITIKINGETVYTTPAKTITSRLTQIYTFEDPVDFLLTEGDEIEFHWTAADQGCISGPNKLTFYGTTPILLPGKVNLISPSGIIGDNLVDFKWSTDDNSTWYKLLVWDDSGKTIHDNWYKSLGTCTESVCSANSVLELANETYKWWVIGWNENGSGPWSDGMEFTISASSNTPPSTATLISPKSTVSSPVTFSWNAVSDATWYQLWVNDQTGNKIKKWYTAAQTGCESGTGTCSVTPSTTLDAGGATWWIQTWNNHGYGPWSPGMNFTTR